MDGAVRHPVHGEMATNRLSAARWRAHLQRTRKASGARGKGQRRSRQGGSVVVAGLTKTVARCRCSLQHPAPWSAPASHPLWTAPAPLPATGPAPHEHRRSPVLAHQQRHGVRLPPSPLLLSSLTPPLLFPCGGEHRKGGKPQLNLGLQEGLGPGGIRARSRRRKGKNTAAHPSWLVRWGHRRGVAGCGWRRRFWRGCGGHWGLFPLGNPRC
jgi:hypothetical protein